VTFRRWREDPTQLKKKSLEDVTRWKRNIQERIEDTGRKGTKERQNKDTG
jgi:hypothetical protein